MESFRLKNIIILILALMNLCLLGLLGVRLTTGYSAPGRGPSADGAAVRGGGCLSG